MQPFPVSLANHPTGNRFIGSIKDEAHDFSKLRTSLLRVVLAQPFTHDFPSRLIYVCDVIISSHIAFHNLLQRSCTYNFHVRVTATRNADHPTTALIYGTL